MKDNEFLASLFIFECFQEQKFQHVNAPHHSPQQLDKEYQDDAVWLISSSFLIFTMHSGFGLLESGNVSAKDEVNIMVKNVVDVVCGGLAYWAVGFGLSYGSDGWMDNQIVGFGQFFYDPVRLEANVNDEAWAYAVFLFQMSLATTASTIVSGAVAERAKLKSYILLGILVTLAQALPAHWVWDKRGFLYQMGVVDYAGCACNHLVGGIIGLVATVYLKPRRNRFIEDSVHQMSSPGNALLGTFLLWWGWFGINTGCVWGVSAGRWRLGGRAAVASIMTSIGGGAVATIVSYIHWDKLRVQYLINGVLSSLVAITAFAPIAQPWHAVIVGGVAALLSISVLPVLEHFHVDDPVGVVPIHLVSSIWGMISVGIFAKRDRYVAEGLKYDGLIYDGGFTLLRIQITCILVIIVYCTVAGYLILACIEHSPLGLRVSDYEEELGADATEHGLTGANVSRYVVEKPMNVRTLSTVTKAVARWKTQTRLQSRATRMVNLRKLHEKRLARASPSNHQHTNQTTEQLELQLRTQSNGHARTE
ncbi:unnamed protein product, partial [Mesorhabditis belari]|uniref:Ammonium transporter n=1 Tax=Mesorhabditis belari TaxID=2138241 RepID=A0AAF3EYV3_9BILA